MTARGHFHNHLMIVKGMLNFFLQQLVPRTSNVLGENAQLCFPTSQPPLKKKYNINKKTPVSFFDFKKAYPDPRAIVRD